jgi:molybdopterin-synthase adenylyltransferase
MSGSASRYDRQIRLNQIGESGQLALRKATVAVVGVGALGSVAADLLARAGIGSLVLIDRDVVEWSNLQRQVLYTEADAEAVRPKVEAAQNRLQRVNGEVQLRPLAIDLTFRNLAEVMDGIDLIIDGTDNFSTRYLLNDYAVKTGIPYIYAGVVSTYGLVASILPPNGPCLRCTYPEPPDASQAPTCSSAGVLGPAVNVIGSLATTEAIRALVGADGMPGFHYMDLWGRQTQSLKAKKDPDCPCCGKGELDWLMGRRGNAEARVLCGSDTVQIPPPSNRPNLKQVEQKLIGTVTELSSTPHFLRFQYRALDVMYFADGRALIRGTADPALARTVLAETVGA